MRKSYKQTKIYYLVTLALLFLSTSNTILTKEISDLLGETSLLNKKYVHELKNELKQRFSCLKVDDNILENDINFEQGYLARVGDQAFFFKSAKNN